MDKEKQLEQLSDKVMREFAYHSAPPVYELFVSLLAMSLAVLLFLFPGILEQNVGLYEYMSRVAGQSTWGIAFLLAGLIGALGMLANITPLRVVALVMLALLFGTMSVIHGFLLPNFGFVFMTWLAVFSAASIPLVKYTGIRVRKQ